MEIAYFLFVILSCAIIEVKNTQIHSRPEYSEKCCKGNEEITSHFFPGISGGYRIVIRKKISSGTEVRVKLDAEGNLVFVSYFLNYFFIVTLYSAHIGRVNLGT